MNGLNTENSEFLSRTMKNLIERAYDLFGKYTVPRQFDVCTCCCVSREEEYALFHTPLRKMSYELLNAYNQSAKNEEQEADEIRYLLPRLLELVALYQFPHHSEEICLDRVGGVPASAWKPEEKALLQTFACQFLLDDFHRHEREQQHLWFLNLDAWFVMFHLAGIDVNPLLHLLLRQSGLFSLAGISDMLFNRREGGRLTTAFAGKGCEELNNKINRWLEDPDTRIRLYENAGRAILHAPVHRCGSVCNSHDVVESLVVLLHGLSESEDGWRSWLVYS